MQGGELYVPRIPSMRIIDLAEAVAPGRGHARGRHPAGREAARGDDRAPTTAGARCASRPLRGPADHRHLGLPPPDGGEPVAEGFTYRSDNNDLWLSVDDLRAC